MATILDVIDNFWAFQPVADIGTARGEVLYKFGAEVRRFAASYSPPTLDLSLHPSYFGGWPSANFWDSLHGDLVMSALLYSGQVLGKDPVSDWFSDDQYTLPHVVAARPGYIDLATQEPNVAATRAFLVRVVPALRAMRPLIEKEIVVLVPSHRFFRLQADAIDRLRSQLAERIEGDAAAFTRQFAPTELPVEDNVRGCFVFAGGDRETQIRKMVDRSLSYFASEYVLASHYGANYTAPFVYEQYLCSVGLESLLRDSHSERVVHALLTSQLPLFSGLSPDKVAEIRDDENFGHFRGSLYELYGSLSPTATPRHIAEAEGALLAPTLKQIRREAERGPAGRMGLEWLGATVRVGATFLPSPLGGVVAGAGEALGLLAGRRQSSGAVTVWAKLFDHGRTVRQEIRAAENMETRNPAGPDYWGIAPEPSMEHIR